jgi:hypothetical protein
VDPDRLRQIVWNLVSNAIKFTPNGGHVDVRLVHDNAEMRLSVRDTGIGFEPAIAAHLFERLRQGDSSSTRQYPGLGLGLGIVRHLVELHGGTVSASSAGENAGALFEVRMPIHSTEAPHRAGTAAGERRAEVSRRTVDRRRRSPLGRREERANFPPEHLR